ncbi:hypothetical protein [Corynebacterium lowii]|uniref:Uncharacterized protein n=1 Tax=Corynebacterium lowii TaxID=1544413 RepID=A0A0Q0YK24_9CORY|nr:hypothetical protein [Corynebacterium lowii]KQB87175.1 hypothetical protein Clow_00228 [Corynebacterium lowii]MDP9852238.1 hypothetical protein [Corynebacterium lowii]
MKVTEQQPGLSRVPTDKEEVSPSYYVFFWEREEYWEHDPLDEVSYKRTSYLIEGARSIIEAEDWRRTNAKGRISALLLPVKHTSDYDNREYTRLILLSGAYVSTPEYTGGFTAEFHPPH